ncbi:hypothetical protein NPX13_g1634 [Xylaria arbuscula]|uniref:Ubiquitin 3 binding protein But2 C-terminal domain-containing protein n=1 Tax=Xylaria arbuscula TaxID=114810 RepID=A0A9W8TR52_9PEZI|nr:hypothetical protein NPX13_g1634 [Xylaria arbuscula]
MLNKFSHLVLFAGFVAKHVAAQDQLMSFDVYSSSDCGTDTSMVWTEKHNLVYAVDTTVETVNCQKSTINWGSWPQVAGKYVSFVDATKIEDDCKLIFYTAAPSDDDNPDDTQCFVPYKAIDNREGCANISIPRKYGLIHCCGDNCDTSIPPPALQTRGELELRSAPTLPRFNGVYNRKRDSECTFEKTGDVTTQYMLPVAASGLVVCPDGNPNECPISGGYTAESSISQSTSESVSVGVSAEFFGIGSSFGYESSVTMDIGSSSSFSRSYTLGVAPGESGYLLFTAKQLCGKGTFNGDTCGDALKVGEQEWCIPALISSQNGTEPDGAWSIFLTN